MARFLVLSVASFSLACGVHAAGSLDSVRSLIEKRSGSNLALRSVLSRLSSADMNSTMEALMLDINRNIVARIKLDHEETQFQIRSVVQGIQAGDRQAKDKKIGADTRGKSLKSCVDAEKQCLIGYEKTFEWALELEQDVVEAEKAFAKVGSVKYSPRSSLPTFTIDFFTGGHDVTSVADKLRMYKQTHIDPVMGKVNDARVTQHGKFATAQTNRATAITTHAKKARRANTQRRQCKKQRGRCADMRGKRVIAMCAFGDELNSKCGAVREYNDLMAKVDAVNGDEFSHVDRVNEWKVIQTALCLVRLLKDQATIDDASLSTCEEGAAASFETQIGTLDRLTDKVDDLSVSSEFTCDVKTITFLGGNYNLAVCGDETCPDQASADLLYTDNYSPAISISEDDDTEPFEFCE